MRLTKTLALMLLLGGFSLTSAAQTPVEAVEAKLTAIKADAEAVLARNATLSKRSKLPLWVSDAQARIVRAASAALLDVAQIRLRWTTVGGALANCELTTVQTAVTAAVSGETVTVPAGDCTWTSALTIATGKNITLTGAGIDATFIRTNAAGQNLIYIAGTSAARVTGFSFEGGGHIQIESNGWRVDHNEFNSATFQEGIWTRPTSHNDTIKGLVDHNVFTNQRVLADGYPDTGLASLNGSVEWSEALGLGTDEAVYVEDNTFTFGVFGNAQDCNYSGRYVLRNNTITGTYVEAHSVQGIIRACRKFEIYDNTMSAAGAYTPNQNMFLRGGTGVVFRNTSTGTYGVHTAWFIIDNVRSHTSAGAPFNLCNGASSWDANTDPDGWRCRDQIGTGGDVAVFDQSAYVAQTSQPMRVWLNTWGGVLGTVYTTNSPSEDHLNGNRDFYVDYGATCSGASCSTGGGTGARASRPANCTTGVFWWSTDQGGNWSTAGGANDGTLDVCTATNTWTNASYTPHTYPHPSSTP